MAYASPEEEWTRGVDEAESAACGDFRVMAMLFRAKYIGAVIAGHEPPAKKTEHRRCPDVGLIGSDGEYVRVAADYTVSWVHGDETPLIDLHSVWADKCDIVTILSAGQLEHVEAECLDHYRNALRWHVSTAKFVEMREAA